MYPITSPIRRPTGHSLDGGLGCSPKSSCGSTAAWICSRLIRSGRRDNTAPPWGPRRVLTKPAWCNSSNKRRITTGLVFTVSASRDDEQHSPSSTAKTAITWTANENRQLFINSKCNLTNYVRKERPNTEVRSSADRGLPIAERVG